MIDRYSLAEMRVIWTKENQFRSWLDVELAVCWALSQIDIIPPQDVDILYKKASFDISRIDVLEKETHHDVVAFTRSVSETLGPEKKWIHYGLTSSDVIDTAWGLRFKQANVLISQALVGVLDILADLSRQYKYVSMVGRTHGIHAEPTTFGLKCAVWYAEFQRQLSRWRMAAKDMEVGKISGSVGNYAHLPPIVEELTCKKLDIQPASISTQIIQRDRHAHYLAVMANIAASLENVALQLRLLQQTELAEVSESFAKGQKGSSSMPHKCNPIGVENITGCARLMRGYMISGYENVALWHERDISHSSVERVVFCDATTLLHYMLHRMKNILKSVVVNVDNMESNMNRTQGLVFSQRILLQLIQKGLSREQAYDIVQPLANQAWRNKKTLKHILLSNSTIKKYLSSQEIDHLFDIKHYMRHVDDIFARIGL